MAPVYFADVYIAIDWLSKLQGPAAEGIPLPQVADSMTAALRSSTAGHALVCEDAIASSHSSFSPYVAVAQQVRCLAIPHTERPLILQTTLQNPISLRLKAV